MVTDLSIAEYSEQLLSKDSKIMSTVQVNPSASIESQMSGSASQPPETLTLGRCCSLPLVPSHLSHPPDPVAYAPSVPHRQIVALQCDRKALGSPQSIPLTGLPSPMRNTSGINHVKLSNFIPPKINHKNIPALIIPGLINSCRPTSTTQGTDDSNRPCSTTLELSNTCRPTYTSTSLGNSGKPTSNMPGHEYSSRPTCVTPGLNTSTMPTERTLGIDHTNTPSSNTLDINNTCRPTYTPAGLKNCRS